MPKKRLVDATCLLCDASTAHSVWPQKSSDSGLGTVQYHRLRSRMEVDNTEIRILLCFLALHLEPEGRASLGRVLPEMGLPDMGEESDFEAALKGEDPLAVVASGWVPCFGHHPVSSSIQLTKSQAAKPPPETKPMEAPDFWQFLRKENAWQAQGVDIVADFCKESQRLRWGCFRRCAWLLDGLRRKNLKQSMERSLGLRKTQVDPLSVALNAFGAVTGFIDLFTDVALLVTVFRRASACQGSPLADCQDYGYMTLAVALTLCVSAPYLIAYSHVVVTLHGRGFFDRSRHPLLGMVLVSCFGPLYMLFSELLLIVESSFWGPVSCLLPDAMASRAELWWHQLFENLALGMPRAVPGSAPWHSWSLKPSHS